MLYYEVFCVIYSRVQYSDLSFPGHTSAPCLHTIHHQTFLPHQTVHHSDQ